MRVRYTDTARSEVLDILDYIAGDNRPAADAVSSAIVRSIGRICSFPRIGTTTEEPGVYATMVWPYRYLIFYQIDTEEIVIRNVRHPARQRPPTG